MFSQRLVRGKRFSEVNVNDDQLTVSVISGPVGKEGSEVKKVFETDELALEYAKRTVSNKTAIGFSPVIQVKQKAGMETRAQSIKRVREEIEIALNVSKKVRRSRRLSGDGNGGFTQADNQGSGVVDSECTVTGEIVSLGSVFPCDVMLVDLNTSTSKDNFVVLQLIQEKGRSDSFIVFKRWGATGEIGTVSEERFDTLAEAALEYCKQFKSYTGTDWMTNNSKPVAFVNVQAPGFYRRILQDDAGRRAIASGNHAQWFYWVDDFVDGKQTGWYPYDNIGSKMTEKLFLESQLNANYTQRVVKSGYFSYLVDLTTKTQTNISHPNCKMRQIRRKPFAQSLDSTPPQPLFDA